MLERNGLRSVEEEWLAFIVALFPALPAESAQYVEMRKAFYAGHFVMFNCVEEIGMPHVTEAEAYTFLERVEKEHLENCRLIALGANPQ